MSNLRYFFRSVEDGRNILPFGSIHLLAILIFIVLIIYTVNLRYKSEVTKKRFIKTIGYIMIIDQILINLWFIFAGTFNLGESLPLFSCRIVVLLFIYSIFTDNVKFKRVSIYWGMMGGILALIFPDMYPYHYPHFTNFHFFIFHYLLMMAAIYYIYVERLEPTKEGLEHALKFTLKYNLFVLLINLIIKLFTNNVNYGYLLKVPKLLEKTVRINGFLYIIIAQLLYLIAVLAMHYIYVMIAKKRISHEEYKFVETK